MNEPNAAIAESPKPRARIAVDLDGMLLSFPTFFMAFVSAMQVVGHEVGILTGRPASENDANLTMLASLGITPSFYVGKPDNSTLENGEFKALACNALVIDVLFDGDREVTMWRGLRGQAGTRRTWVSAA